MRTRVRRTQHGFTLVEIVIAVSILSIALGTLFMVYASVIQQAAVPRMMNTGAHLVEQELERVTALRFSQVNNEGPTAFPGSFSDYTYEVSVTAVPPALADDAAMTQYKQVEIIVRRGAQEAARMTTIMTHQ